MAPFLDPNALHYLAATADDQAVVVTLMNELVKELDPSEAGERIIALMPHDIAQALASPNVQIFIAWDEAQAVGLSRGDILLNDPIFRLRDNPRCGYVDQMYVRPGYRDHSVGERLLQCCEQWFKQQGVQHVLLHAAPKAVRFYARCGYQPNREMFKELT